MHDDHNLNQIVWMWAKDDMLKTHSGTLWFSIFGINMAIGSQLAIFRMANGKASWRDLITKSCCALVSNFLEIMIAAATMFSYPSFLFVMPENQISCFQVILHRK